MLNVVGLAPAHLARPELIPHLAKLARTGAWRPMRPSFPAVTCSVQATLLSGKPPSEHGIIANGFFDRATREVKFWEQPGSLVQAPRLWDLLKARRPELKTAVLFWQNSMFINSDIVVTPRPLHLDHKFIQWCYSKPAGYYEKLQTEISDFKLQSYWGPFAGLASSRWIARAAQVTWREHRPNLLAVYLPHLDYAAQKFGPDAPETHQALREIDAVVGELLADFSRDAAVIVCSEYALSDVHGVMYPNRLLRDAGLLRVREIAGQEFLDFELSDAFAMVDHQVAHIFCKPGLVETVWAALGNVEFTAIAHERAGELVAVAPRGKWFAYYWWNDWAKAPAFARTIDIHRKPGYDPCELWFDWPRTLRALHPTIATTPELVRGSHGRVGDDGEGWATLVLDEKAAAAAPLRESVAATDVAPLVCDLLLK